LNAAGFAARRWSIWDCSRPLVQFNQDFCAVGSGDQKEVRMGSIGAGPLGRIDRLDAKLFA
jgi:hypothetical protein